MNHADTKPTPPIMREFPEEFETKRLVIRAPRSGDGGEMHIAALETLDELKLWMPWAKDGIKSEYDYEVLAREGRLRFLSRSDLWLLLYHKESGAFLGGSGLHRIDWSVPRFEIGYWCRKRFMGQGYVTEAVTGITEFAFEMLGANRVEIHCDSRNVKSRAVAERCSYILEGQLRNYTMQNDGSLETTLIFGMTKEDYEERER